MYQKGKGGGTDIALHNLVQRAAGRLEDGLDVLGAGAGFVGDAALDERAGRVGGDLARDVEGVACADGLGLFFGGVWSQRFVALQTVFRRVGLVDLERGFALVAMVGILNDVHRVRRVGRPWG